MIVAFEGIDGAGKGTQSKKFSDKLSEYGLPNECFSFPNYGKTVFADETAKYLKGEYGDINSLPPEFPSLLYALDRYEMKTSIIEALNKGKIIIFDRYVPSNYVYQAAKLSECKQEVFIKWVEKTEYDILKLPKPDVVFFLDTPPDISHNLVLKKEKRSYTDEKEDMHEKNTSYLKNVYELYKKTAVNKQWHIIQCTKNGQMRTKDEISDDIIKLIKFKL